MEQRHLLTNPLLKGHRGVAEVISILHIGEGFVIVSAKNLLRLKRQDLAKALKSLESSHHVLRWNVQSLNMSAKCVSSEAQHIVEIDSKSTRDVELAIVGT